MELNVADEVYMNKKSLKIFPWLLVAYEIVIYLSMDAYMPALPRIAHVFGVSVSAAQMTVIVWMIGALIPQLVIGPLTDRYGRRRTWRRTTAKNSSRERRSADGNGGTHFVMH